MEKRLKLTDDSWIYGSYHRIGYKRDMLYTFFQYVDFQAIFNVGMGTFTLKDRLAERLVAQGMIPGEMLRGYYGMILRFMAQMQTFDTWPIEQIYGEVRKIRRQVLGEDVLEQDRKLQMQKGCEFVLQDGIDQSAKKEDLIREKDALIVALCQPELFPLMEKDVEKALAMGHKVHILVSEEQAAGLPTREEIQEQMRDMVGTDMTAEISGMHAPMSGLGAHVSGLNYLTMQDENLGLNFAGISWDADLQNAIDQNRAAMLVYGEEGLMHCRNLRIGTIVQAIPFGYHVRAMVNQLDGERPCVFYVPPHFDITQWVGMTEKTKLSYWQLWQLWKDHGDSIYEMSVEQLYRSFPQYFLNVYENGASCLEAEMGYPLQVCWREDAESDQESKTPYADTIASYYHLRDKAIAEYINSQEGLTYLSTYFTKELEETEIPWECTEQQTGILVHGIRMATAENARVINCDTSLTLRQQLAQEGALAPLRLFSNFLFFLTPKLAELYNELRKDRPQEQLNEKQGHLDYKLIWQAGKRVETFPLYRKAVLAKKKDGRFLLCQYRLGGGALSVVNGAGAKYKISWSADAVDSVLAEMAVQIYTPYYSCKDQSAETNTYRREVGEGRVNLVIIQDKICCIRRGDVILPSIGVVISLSEDLGTGFMRELGLVERENGYFDVTDLELTVTLDGPAQIDATQWQQVEWTYGGGLSLIMNGHSIYEVDGETATKGSEAATAEGSETDRSSEKYEEAQGTVCLAEEGWLSPLSRQTQESALHVLAKHPRTAIGITKDGDLFVLVFSGRTLMSTGADYQEMCRIAKALIPDVEAMMNVDGGGSSVLGLAIDGHFMELSYPATSLSSCAGMVRKVNTVLSLEP